MMLQLKTPPTQYKTSLTLRWAQWLLISYPKNPPSKNLKSPQDRNSDDGPMIWKYGMESIDYCIN